MAEREITTFEELEGAEQIAEILGNIAERGAGAKQLAEAQLRHGDPLPLSSALKFGGYKTGDRIDWGRIDFPVELQPLYTPTPGPRAAGKARHLRLPDRMAVVRQDTNDVLQVVGSEYNLKPHREAVEPIAEALQKIDIPIHGTRVRTAYNGGFASVEWLVGQPQEVVSVAETVAFTIGVRNSLDLRAKYEVFMAALVLRCANGMMIPEQITSFSQRHTGALSVARAVEELQQFIDAQPQVLGILSDWGDEEIDMGRFEEWLLRQDTLLGKKAVAEIMAYTLLGPDFCGPTIWDAIQAVTWFATHKKTARNAERLVVSQDAITAAALRLPKYLAN